MKEFINCTIFSLTCFLTPIIVAAITLVIADICNKLQPKVNRLVDRNYR